MTTEASFHKQAHFLDRDGNRDEFSQKNPLFGQMLQQSRVFRNKPTFWTEVATEASFQKQAHFLDRGGDRGEF